MHRVRLEPAEIMRRGGLPVTSPERTAFDLGSGRDPVAAVVALDALLYQRAIKPAALMSIAWERMGRPGARRHRRAASLARPHVEYDGDHHRERDTFQHDAVRLNRLRLLDWTILRFTAADVLRLPERLITQVAAALKIAIDGKLATSNR